MPGPLAGLRVLELARILAGPWAGQVLADLGADVIKVERSKTGDDTRAWGPPFIEGKDGGHLGAAYFHSTNRGKRSIECDFETEDGKRIVRKLAARSDVLIENFKVGGLAKFGLDYKSLAPECPRQQVPAADKDGQGRDTDEEIAPWGPAQRQIIGKRYPRWTDRDPRRQQHGGQAQDDR